MLPIVHPSPHPSPKDVQIKNFEFIAGPAPPTQPNTDPHCYHWALCPPGLPHTYSPLNRDAWESHLSDYLDREFVDAILNIIDVGESIGHSGPPKNQLCKNLRSALDHKEVISKEVNSLLAEGCIHGPFEEPPLPNFRCSPLGTSTRKRNPKRRIFNHYSWPELGSVNDEMPDIEGEIHYDSFESAAAVLRDSG